MLEPEFLALNVSRVLGAGFGDLSQSLCLESSNGVGSLVRNLGFGGGVTCQTDFIDQPFEAFEFGQDGLLYSGKVQHYFVQSIVHSIVVGLRP